MKKRILCLLLVLAMMLGISGMLASCGGNEDEDFGGERDDKEFTDDEKGVSKYYEYTWSTKTLNVELSEHTCAQELVSRVKRYLAGKDTNYNDPLDDDIRYRNGRATTVCRTDINYTYLPDITAYEWGANISRMASDSQSYSDTSADIYVNFMYDTVSASLQGAFANLRSTTMYKSEGKNYFEFVYDENYDATVDDEGYMYDLMNSLSFSTRKMYVLASDYLTDVVRAFFIVPVNIAMLEGIDVTMVEQYNADGNDEFTVDDFYESIIWDYQWNYDAIKVLSAAVHDQLGENVNVKEDIHGFILDGYASGLMGSGLLYGSGISIISRTLNKETGFYDVTYPTSAGAYGDFCDAVTSLFSSTGVYGLKGYAEGGKNGEPDYNLRTNTPAMLIEELFANDQVLFGGIICAGNLERQSYQEMLAKGEGYGVAVAPVPMYRTFDAALDVDANGVNRYYRTASHNIAKVAAISVATTKFKECTAWLDYQSTHSTDILNYYYDQELQYAIAGGDSHTVKVLQELRKNVSTALDKIYDDAVCTQINQKGQRFCELYWRGGFQPKEIRTKYTAAIQIKEDFLKQLQKKFEDDQLLAP